MAYVINIDGVADLSEEIATVKFESKIPDSSNVRSSNHDTVLTINGRLQFDNDKVLMRDHGKAIAEWSLVKPDSPDTYKKITVSFTHAGSARKFEFPHAFLISYTETFTDLDGTFVLVVKQKSDRQDEVVIE